MRVPYQKNAYHLLISVLFIAIILFQTPIINANTTNDIACSDISESYQPPHETICHTPVESIFSELTGPFCVGTKEILVPETDRTETFTETDDDNRELTVQLWYPTDVTTNKYIDYMDHDIFTWMSNSFLHSNLLKLPEDAIAQVQSRSQLNTPLATYAKQYPLIIFSHGLFYSGKSYLSLVEELASHGFIVAAINHSYISGLTKSSSGKLIHHTKIPNNKKAIQSMIQKGFNVMSEDVSLTLDHLSKHNNIESEMSPFDQCSIDFDKVGMLGHSLGGAVALNKCLNDERVQACINLDGVPLGNILEEGATKPILILRSVNLFHDKEFEKIWDHHQSEGYSVRIIGTGHGAYTDIGILLKHFFPRYPRIFSGIGALDPHESIEITNQYIRLFFNAYLNDEITSPLIDLKKKYRKIIFKEY